MKHETRERMVRMLSEVVTERERQEELWGVQNHDAGRWLLILTEEVGEWSQAVLDAKDPAHIREELVQVVAVALSMLECNDRNKGKPAL